MITLERIKNEILLIADKNAYYTNVQIEFYIQEDGSGIWGECFNKEREKISPLIVSKLSLDFDRLISEWNTLTSFNDSKWNKAELTVYNNGTYEVRTWWDGEFQKSLYGTEDKKNASPWHG